MITLGHYLKPYSKRIALGTVIKIVGTITELFLPWILSYMIDEVAPEKNVARIFLWGAVMLACAVVALLGNITANRMASKVARDTTESMRFDLFDKTLNLSARQTDGFAMPSLVSRLSSDTYNVHNMIGMIQRLGIRAPMLLIGGIVVTFMVEPVLALVLLAVVLLWVFGSNQLVLTAVHPQLASSRGIATKRNETLFTVAISIVVTLAMSWVGLMVINSLLVLPAAASRNLARNLRQYHLFSILSALGCSLLGLMTAYVLGCSAGATIALYLAAYFAVSFALRGRAG